jgi:hypothetical protein
MAMVAVAPSGEEDGVERSALSGGIDLTSWYAIGVAACVQGFIDTHPWSSGLLRLTSGRASGVFQGDETDRSWRTACRV